MQQCGSLGLTLSQTRRCRPPDTHGSLGEISSSTLATLHIHLPPQSTDKVRTRNYVPAHSAATCYTRTHAKAALRTFKCEMHCWTSEFPYETEKKKVFFSLKEFIAQFQTVWCNLQLGVPLCIAGDDKGMPWVAEIWSSSLLWCGKRTRSCAEAQTYDSRVIDCFGPDTSADGSHCFYSLLFRLLSPPFALLLDSPARISHCFSKMIDFGEQSIELLRAKTQVAAWTTCLTPDRVEPHLANVLTTHPRAPVHLQLGSHARV